MLVVASVECVTVHGIRRLAGVDRAGTRGNERQRPRWTSPRCGIEGVVEVYVMAPPSPGVPVADSGVGRGGCQCARRGGAVRRT